MKKSIFIVLVCGASFILPTMACTNSADAKNTVEQTSVQNVKPEDSFAKIQFDKLRADMGKFPSKDPVHKAEFQFTNTGTAPLVIHQALASCGCTVPTYPKTPIKPGEKGVIEVTYNGTGKFPGHFQKTITIRTNATNEVVRLTIEGEMTE